MSTLPFTGLLGLSGNKISSVLLPLPASGLLCALNHLLISELYKSFACLLNFPSLVTYFFPIYFLMYFLKTRPIPFPD